jgi:GR25 family glycosyltransferase involved in LPS biosynthesis
MSKFNEKFDKIFVISLENEKRRQNNIKTQLDKNNINFDFFIVQKPNINNINLLEQEYNLDIKDYEKLNYGVIGCYDSHLKLWKQIIDNSWNNVLIFEDDIIFNNNVEVLEHIPSDYDIFYFGFEGGKNLPINDYIGYPTKPACTHAYALSNKGSKILYKCGKMNIKSKCGQTVDGFLGGFPSAKPYFHYDINREYKKYSTLKNLITQNKLFQSSIQI